MAGHDEAELVDGIGRVGHQDHVARRRNGLRHVGEALLGAQRRHDVLVGVEPHAEPPLIIGRLRLAQPRNALGGRIPVRPRLVDGLHHLVDDVLRRRHVRIAHAEIYDVGAAGTRIGLQPVHLRKNIRRQSLDAVEFLDHGRSLRKR
jgi:hypothetical protein